jgi:glycerophosphoryl diester phosphodiesterase
MNVYVKLPGFILVTGLISVVACNSAAKNVNAPAFFDKQGHRGCRGLMPENTIPAMIRAIDLGVTTLEMDAVITADKKVILSHEQHYNPSTTSYSDGRPLNELKTDSLVIYKMTYNESTAYDVGLKPYPAFPGQERVKAIKPLLADVIDTVEVYTRSKGLRPVQYNIETKSKGSGDNQLHPAPEEYVDLIMKVVMDKKVAPRTIIQSFDFRTLRVMHKKYPLIRLAALVQNEKSLDENLQDIGFVPAIYSPNYLLVTAELVKQCHEKDMKIIPWTVNDKEQIELLRTMGVDGIISDFPDLF